MTIVHTQLAVKFVGTIIQFPRQSISFAATQSNCLGFEVTSVYSSFTMVSRVRKYGCKNNKPQYVVQSSPLLCNESQRMLSGNNRPIAPAVGAPRTRIHCKKTSSYSKSVLC